jgi:pimeloyl-ACP methyl ester carboxylesterase
VPDDIVTELKKAIEEGRPGDAAEVYLTKGAGMSVEEVAQMRAAPYWGPSIEAVAPTLVYDAMFMDGTMRGKPLPADRWTNVTMPVLITNSVSSFVWADASAEALAELLPNATRKVFEGEAHDISPETLAPELIKFFE